jgi:hypothetical protein
LCEVFDHPKPAGADPAGEWFTLSVFCFLFFSAPLCLSVAKIASTYNIVLRNAHPTARVSRPVRFTENL